MSRKRHPSETKSTKTVSINEDNKTDKLPKRTKKKHKFELEEDNKPDSDS